MMEEREMEPQNVTAGERPRHLWLRLLKMVAPATGRRRVWDTIDYLEGQILERDLQLAAKDRVIEELRRKSGADERFINHLIDQHACLTDQVKDLEKRLITAVEANKANELMVAFDFHERLIDEDDPEDQVTAAISVQELRDDLSRDEPITGKVLQVNPETGEHETVETPLKLIQVESPDLVNLREAIESHGHRLGQVKIVSKPAIVTSPHLM